MKLCLVVSSGGHLYQMLCLKEFWQNKERCWVTFPMSDAKYLLRDEKVVYWAAHPTNRNPKNALKNLYLAQRILRKDRPDMIMSTGSGVAVPFMWMGRLLGIPTVYVESITRFSKLSLTGRLVYPIVTKFLVQSEQLAAKLPRAEFHGRII